MNRIVVRSKVGRDGVLHLSLPLGLNEAEEEVQVTVEPCHHQDATTQEEWRSWVQAMAGSWQGDFVRPEQGAFEEREPLS